MSANTKIAQHTAINTWAFGAQIWRGREKRRIEKRGREKCGREKRGRDDESEWYRQENGQELYTWHANSRLSDRNGVPILNYYYTRLTALPAAAFILQLFARGFSDE